MSAVRKYKSKNNIYNLSEYNSDGSYEKKPSSEKYGKAIRKDKKTKNKWISKKGNYDVTLITVVLILVVFGLVMVFSASAPTAIAYQNGNQYHFILRQGIFAILGALAMFGVARIDYHFYGKIAKPILFGSFLILLAVYIPGLGMVVNEARRWINLGIISFQPSEIAKIGVIIFFAYSLSSPKHNPKDFVKGFLTYVAIIGAFGAVLMKEPHFSCTVVLCASCILIMIVSGTKFWHLSILGVLGVALGAYLILSAPYRMERIFAFMDPFADTADTGYQISNSLYAIGSGGIFGLGLGMSRQKLLYLPEPHNDFIFAVICEELGLLGAIVVIVLFIMLIWRGFRIAQCARDSFGAYLAAGITSLIGIQAILNIAVVTSSVPVTGVALPFFSYGGTSLLILLASMGILLNISSQCKNLGTVKKEEEEK